MAEHKLVLVSPPLLWEDKLRTSFQPPLNLLYLHVWLRRLGVAVELVDPIPRRRTLAETIDQIASLAPTFVGMPLYYASLADARAMACRLRERIPGVLLIAGGPCLTMEPERMMREGGYDFGIIGEGEETLAALLTDKPPATIEGLVWRRQDKIIVNPPRRPIADLDSLPFLDFSVIDNESYFRHQDAVNVPRTLFLNSSRGCSFRCTYCCTPVLWPGPIRRYSPQRLVREIAFHHERFPEAAFGFCDDSFFSDRAWLCDFMALVKPLQIKYQCIGRADHLTTDLVRALVDSGMNYIAFGVETGSALRQIRLKKHLNLPALLEKTAELSRFAVTIKCFFMLGFPDETWEEMAETINLAVALKKTGMTSFSLFPVTVYPGTELARQFPHRPFICSLDAHLPEIIRDDLGITRQSPEFLDSPFNDLLTQRQMVSVITWAWHQIEQAQTVTPDDLRRIAHTPPPLSSGTDRV